jgi:hypothetical protein
VMYGRGSADVNTGQFIRRTGRSHLSMTMLPRSDKLIQEEDNKSWKLDNGKAVGSDEFLTAR